VPKLRDVIGESERLRQRREAVQESAKALDRLTRELGHEPGEESADPRAAVDEALQDLANPDAAA
jgi:hypothetical protein